MRPSALLLLAAVLAGCGGPGADAPSPAPSGGTKILDVGGGGPDVTGLFETHTPKVRIDYRLTQMPTSRQIVLTLERDGGSGTFETTNSSTESVPDGLGGSKTFDATAGRYRLRVSAEGTWSAAIYETK